MTTKDLKDENIIILDVETARPDKKDLTGSNGVFYYQNAKGKNLVYDLGLQVVSLPKGKTILSKNIVIKEIFTNEMFMNSAYYKDKIPQYVVDIANKKRQVLTISQTMKEVQRIVDKYNIEKIFAYNCNFDKNALNETARYLTRKTTQESFFKAKNFFFGCIWHIACQSILNTDEYRKFCKEHNLISSSGRNITTSAEACYKFITNNASFEEKHTGLEDVKIEKQILLECLKTDIECDMEINTGCWQIPQKD